MRRRDLIGVLAGVVMILSGLAHSVLGWRAMDAQLKAIDAPADLVLGLLVGWHFAGLAILVFGAIALWTFAGRLAGRAVDTTPALWIGASYLIYGLGALAVSSWNPFFLVFVVPGLMVSLAARPTR